MSKKDRIRNIFNLILGVLFISTTILGYYKDISYMSEYCFISGIVVGLILIGSFIYYSFPKSHVSYRKPRAVSTQQRERARQMMIERNREKVD